MPDVRLVAIVTAPPRPVGRTARIEPTPVETRAVALRLPVLAPERLRDPAAVAALASIDAVVGVLADYGKILPQAVLDLFPKGVLNLHPSLLPRHRGAAPIPAAIAAGDTETGVTLFRMDAGMDTGPVIAVERIALAGSDDAPALEARLAETAAALLGASLGPWLEGRLTAVPQGVDGITVTRPLRREDGHLDATHPAAALERLVRALRPWPGTYLQTGNDRFGVLDASVGESKPGDEAGRIFADDGDLSLATIAGRLRLLRVQPAGGRPMDGAAYLRGRPGLAGSRVG